MVVFIVSIDGPDFSGKTTISNILVELLRRKIPSKADIVIRRTKLPSNELVTGSFTGILRSLRIEIAPEEYSLAYALDHLHYYRLKIRPLERCKQKFLVIQERSLLTTFIYQGLIGGVDMNWLREVNKYCRAIPHITFILKVDINELIRRMYIEGRVTDAFESESHIRKQASTYYNLPKDLLEEFNVKYVDATREPFDVAKDVCNTVIEELRRRNWI
ncbi:MAG: hypothetical protein DRN53_06185 [Thermoprotei archaeon]|nr:MAG: hypothetical protein DRN53_06185 [Thermoprotei archaeon]